VPQGTEVFEPRLLGNWEAREDSAITGRFVVTQEGAALYLIRQMDVHLDYAVYAGRLGPLGSEAAGLPHRELDGGSRQNEFTATPVTFVEAR